MGSGLVAQSELAQLGVGGPRPFQILADKLNIFKPQGQVMPTTLILAHRIFRPSYGPVVNRTSRKPNQLKAPIPRPFSPTTNQVTPRQKTIIITIPFPWRAYISPPFLFILLTKKARGSLYFIGNKNNLLFSQQSSLSLLQLLNQEILVILLLDFFDTYP